MRIEGKAAVVTGGASGLGAATARRLAAIGARVTIFDVNEGQGRAHAAAIGGEFQRVDVADEASVARGLEDASRSQGTAQVLVNCAGITPPLTPIVSEEGGAHGVDILRRVIEINLVGSFICLSRFAARLTRMDTSEEERGVVINTASIAAYEASMGLAAYAASKGGVVAMTLPAARELAQYRIRVSTIAPGMFDTAMVSHLPAEVQSHLARAVPFPNRLGHADEFASMAVAIIENPMANGTTMRLDGAYRLPP